MFMFPGIETFHCEHKRNVEMLLRQTRESELRQVFSRDKKISWEPHRIHLSKSLNIIFLTLKMMNSCRRNRWKKVIYEQHNHFRRLSYIFFLFLLSFSFIFILCGTVFIDAAKTATEAIIFQYVESNQNYNLLATCRQNSVVEMLFCNCCRGVASA